MADISPPPTYAEVVLVDEKTKQGRFNPIWLRWFLDLARILNTAGGTTINHNDTGSIQGGSASERYHLTAAEVALIGPSMSDNVLLQRVFRQAVSAPQVSWANAENIIAGQVFGG